MSVAMFFKAEESKIEEVFLGDFVEQTITQIINAIQISQSKFMNSESSVEICPSVNLKNLSQSSNVITSASWKIVNEIEFDVAISARSSGSANGGVKVTIVNIGGKILSERGTVSKVKFKIPISYPAMPRKTT